MRTTININDALLDELKKRAADRKRPFREVLEETLQRGLASSTAPSDPIRIETAPVGVKPAYTGLSMNQLYDQIEAEDIQKVAEP